MNKNKGGVTVSAMLAIVAPFLFHPDHLYQWDWFCRREMVSKWGRTHLKEAA